MRTPTERQYKLLLAIGSGSAWLSATKRECGPLLRHGWVTAEWRPPYYQFVRITPEGLRALAAAVERYDLPDLFAGDQKPTTQVRVCAKCGSERYRYETREVAA
jgi:hypothetical protein